jgi:magnesium transporter
MTDFENDQFESEEEKFESVEEMREENLENRFEELIRLLDDRQYAVFARELHELNPVDAADFFSELNPKRIPAVFRLIGKDFAADIFAELDGDIQKRIIEAMTDKELSFIMEELALDDAVDALSELPANIVTRIMKNVTAETRTEINRFLAYEEASAGSIMTAEFIYLRSEMTVSQAIEHIKRTGVDKETVYNAYVTDDRKILIGTISFKELLFAGADKKIGDIMETDPIYATTADHREFAADTIAKYGLLALPIVDKEKRLVGIVTVDDAMDVINEEATEDIEIMAAITPSDKPYLKTGVLETWKNRFPWLLVLMLSAIFSFTFASIIIKAIAIAKKPTSASISAYHGTSNIT